MMMTRFIRLTLCLILTLSVAAARAATPQEEAFLKVWNIHVKEPNNHDGVITAAQSVMQRASQLGDYLPVVTTLAAWHLLAAGKQSDATRVFESVLTTDKAAPAIVRAADQMARRWLSRMECAEIDRVLKTYYVDHVEYPLSLAPVLEMPIGKTLKRMDRFGEPWVYRIEPMSKLVKAKNQRYSCYSKTIGKAATSLKTMPLTQYGKKTAAIVGRRSANPITFEFEVTAETGVTRGIAGINGVANGVRFLKSDSDGRYALLVESEGDYWVVATPKR